MPIAVILTALPVEYLAVRSHLSNLQEELHPLGTIYERGTFIAHETSWSVGVAEVGAGNAGAAVEAERAIAHFKPDFLFFVGIAGGIKDVNIGDVVAATKVYGYESGKVGETFSTRPAVGQAAYALIQRARTEARNGDWVKRISERLARQPKANVAPIAAGEKVIASTDSELFQFIRNSYNDAIAVEMEGYGFLSAAFAYPELKAIVIRGISDLIKDKNADDPDEGNEEERQDRASQNASAFAFELLAKLNIKSTQQAQNNETLSESVLSKSSLSFELPRITAIMHGTAETSASQHIFISYSHDSSEHKERVLALSDQLREDGLAANIDQYEESPHLGWQRWMLDQVEKADYVLVVCTEQYDRRFRGKEAQGKGKGVTWEGSVIINELYDAQGKNSKFIPIIFSPEDSEFIPSPLRDATSYRLHEETGYEDLYRRLTDQPLISKPLLGRLRQLPPRDRKQFFFKKKRHNRLKAQIDNASKGLLNWPRRLGKNKHEIDRPELKKLQNLITDKDSSTTIVLGSPGCGKSSLMASIGHWLKEKHVTVLGIKADFLSNNVQTLKDLQEEIQLDISLPEAIRAIAHQEKIVLLIDQLDALSELLDRYPARLNILLSLIESLSDTDNVHIITTCREFEFHHGTQFSQLEHFDSLTLQLPGWNHVALVLRDEQHDPETIGDSLRHLLQNPFHLKIFLDTAQPGETFSSLSRLLDKLWDVRIIQDSQSESLITCLSNVAEQMTDDEILWLSASAKDNDPNSFQRLEKLGILMTNPENSTIGFCHQTLYDHTLARSFARGTQSLSELILERQDGLFIRPILLRSLNYLRVTAINEYHKQVGILLETSKQIIRQHIRDLVIEFVGSQSEPSSNEIQFLIPLLNSDLEGVKALNAIRSSPGWFSCLSSQPEFTQWLEKPPTQALYCQLFLMNAVKFDAEGVWYLLEEFWLDYPDYDALSIRTIWDINQWTQDRVFLIEQIIRRTKVEWNEVSRLAERVAATMPIESMKFIRAHLDHCYEQAMNESRLISESSSHSDGEYMLTEYLR